MAIPDGRTAALELRESLEAERAYLKKTIIQAIVTTLVLVLFCGLLAMALGIIFVGRPVRRLVDHAKRIGTGDLSPEVTLAGNDEISELAGEMNAMCLRLHESRTRLEEETAGRLTTLDQLRHARRVGTPLAPLAQKSQVAPWKGGDSEKTSTIASTCFLSFCRPSAHVATTRWF